MPVGADQSHQGEEEEEDSAPDRPRDDGDIGHDGRCFAVRPDPDQDEGSDLSAHPRE